MSPKSISVFSKGQGFQHFHFYCSASVFNLTTRVSHRCNSQMIIKTQWLHTKGILWQCPFCEDSRAKVPFSEEIYHALFYFWGKHYLCAQWRSMQSWLHVLLNFSHDSHTSTPSGFWVHQISLTWCVLYTIHKKNYLQHCRLWGFTGIWDHMDCHYIRLYIALLSNWIINTFNYCSRNFPTFLNQGPGATWFGKNSTLIFKIGKTWPEKLKSLFYCKIIQKHGKLHFRTIKILWILFLKIFIKTYHKSKCNQ